MRAVVRSCFRGFAALTCLAAILVAAPGCDRDKDGQNPATQPVADQSADGEGERAADTEVTSSPDVLYDPSVSPAEFTLYGVKIGDPETSLRATDVSGKPDESGWVGYRGNANVFRLENGRVQNMSLTDPAVLSRLNVKGEADLIAKFGKDYKSQQFGPNDETVPYFFKERWLTVYWNRKQGKVTSINVGP